MQPCDPPKSRLPGGGCHKGVFPEAGLKLNSNPLNSICRHRHKGVFPEAGLKLGRHRRIDFGLLSHKGVFPEAGLKHDTSNTLNIPLSVTKVFSRKRV